MSVTAIDLQVDNVRAGTKLLSEAYGWDVLTDGDSFGGLMAGQTRVMLSVEAGAELVEGPVKTDLGTEAAYLGGPGKLIVDLCRDT